MPDAINEHAMDALLLTKFDAPAAFWNAIGQAASAFPHVTVVLMLKNLLWVTLGNMIGGVVVGITYWFIYRRHPKLKPPA